MIETIFILYLLLIICVGIFSNKFVTSQLDFLLAGRRLGPWVTAFSERASGESAWLLLGLPGAAIAIGYGEIWAVIGITIGIILSWFLIAEKLRDETEKLNSLMTKIENEDFVQKAPSHVIDDFKIEYQNRSIIISKKCNVFKVLRMICVRF